MEIKIKINTILKLIVPEYKGNKYHIDFSTEEYLSNLPPSTSQIKCTFEPSLYGSTRFLALSFFLASYIFGRFGGTAKIEHLLGTLTISEHLSKITSLAFVKDFWALK